jgi:hypothetical protein
MRFAATSSLGAVVPDRPGQFLLGLALEKLPHPPGDMARFARDRDHRLALVVHRRLGRSR